MLRNTAFLLLAVATGQVLSELNGPNFIEDVVKKQPATAASALRVVSGWEAVLGQHPHHANLRMVNAMGEVMGCGGAFVHREWLITAAQCTALRVTILVRGGLVSLTQPEYIFETTDYWNYPTYDGLRPGDVQNNDISIVKLGRPLTYSRYIQPIRIQSSADAFKNYGEELLYVSGHGTTWTNGHQPENLRWVYLRGVSNYECARIFGPVVISANSICAKWYNVTSQSTCEGDSGGPLVYVDAEGERTLVGVSTFIAGGGYGCHSGIPAGFVRPGPFLSWFNKVSGIDFENLKEEDDEPTTQPPTEETTNPSTDNETATLPPTFEVTTPPTDDEKTPLPHDHESDEEEDIIQREDDNHEDDISTKEEDNSPECIEENEDLSEHLKHLQVNVKVMVNVNQFKSRKTN